MNKLRQVIANLVLYGFLVYLLVDATLVEWDPWFAFVVLFVLVLAIVISVIPSLHAKQVSPGHYPFDD